MNRFKKKKQEQLQTADEQARGPLPASHDHHEEDYLSGAFVDQPPTSTSSSKRAAEPPPLQATSKKAKAANAAEKLQEGMNTPLSQVLTFFPFPPILALRFMHRFIPFPYPYRTMSACGCSS